MTDRFEDFYQRKCQQIRNERMNDVLEEVLDDLWVALGPAKEQQFRVAAALGDTGQLGELMGIAIGNCVHRLAMAETRREGGLAASDRHEARQRDEWFRTQDLKKDIKRDSSD